MVRSPSGADVPAEVVDGEVRFETDGEGAHSVSLEYDESGTTWVKSVRINAREAGLDTPPAVHEQTDDGQYALASGLSDAEVADEAGGTEKRMTAVIGADEKPPGVVHYHPTLDESDEKIRLEVKSGEYRETVRNRVSTAVHVELSEDALVWVDGTPVDADGSTSAGSIQRTNGSKEIVRTMTDEYGETKVRVVQNPSRTQGVYHTVGIWLESVPVASTTVDVASSTAAIVLEAASTLLETLTATSAEFLAFGDISVEGSTSPALPADAAVSGVAT
jgi:hypothetical protein